MKVRIDIQDVHEEVEAATPEELLRRAKEEAAKRAPFMMRGLIKAMSDLKFAEEAVKFHNRSRGQNDAIPGSASDFLDWAVSRGYVKIIER